MAASAPAMKEPELADQVKAQLSKAAEREAREGLELTDLQQMLARGKHEEEGRWHYSSAPHHRRFEMAITAGLGGVGFKSMVMRGAITAGCKTVGDRKAYHRRFSNRW